MQIIHNSINMSSAQTMIVFECNEEKVRGKEGRSIAYGVQFTVINKYTCVTENIPEWMNKWMN